MNRNNKRPLAVMMSEEETHEDDSSESTTTVSLVQPEILRHIVSYLSANDLLCWDAVCRDFRDCGARQWGRLAHQKFGVAASQGKKGWKLGVSVTKRPVIVQLQDDEDFGCGDYIAGTAAMATNQSLLAVVSDDIDSEPATERNFPQGLNGIVLRDAITLNYYRTLPSPITNFRVAICGQEGCEIVVTSNHIELCAIRGKVSQVWTLPSMADWPTTGNGIPILGCEGYLIVIACGQVHLYDVDLPQRVLVELKMKVRISNELEDPKTGQHKEMIEDIAWGPDHHFTFVEENSQEIHIWKLERDDGLVSPLRSIATGRNIANSLLSDNFVVGTIDKKISIWNRETGELCHEDLCDVDDEDEDPEDIVYPLCMQIVSGDLMISSSMKGFAFCMWDLKTGNMLKRYDDFLEGPTSTHDAIPDGCDMTSMVYLRELNAFCGVGGYLCVCSFPTDDPVATKRIASICRRERNILRVRVGLGEGEMRGDCSDGDY